MSTRDSTATLDGRQTSWQRADLQTLWDSPRIELRYLAEDLIGINEAVVFAGEPAAGKTMLCAALAVAVAAGEPVFGRFDVASPGRVLYLDEETGAIRLVERFKKIAEGIGADAEAVKENLRLLGQQGHRIAVNDRKAIDVLFREVRQFRPNLVIMDTFIAFFGGDENKNSDVRPWFTTVVGGLKREGCAVVLPHHVRKANDFDKSRRTVRGAGDIEGFPDKVWLASKLKENGPDPRKFSVNVETKKARNGDELAPFTVTVLDASDRRATIVDALRPGLSAQAGDMQKHCGHLIMAILRRHGGQRRRGEIRDEVLGQVKTTRRTFNRAVEWLQEQGYVDDPTPRRRDAVVAATGKRYRFGTEPRR